MKKVNLQGDWKKLTIRLTVSFFAILTMLFIGLSTNEPISEAAVPSSGTITPTVGTTLTWTGDRTVGTAANGEPSCTTGDDKALNCDVYTLTVPPGNWTGKVIRVQFNWLAPSEDYDMIVRRESNRTPGMQGDGAGVLPPNTNDPPTSLDVVIATSAQGTNTQEEVILSPPDSGETYYVRAIYFAVPNIADQYKGSALVETNVVSAPPLGTCALPSFDNYQPPVGYPRRDGSGEPSIGINWNTGNVMTMSRLQANRTTFTDSTSPADPVNGVTWFPRPIPLAPTGLDPIGYTDPITGRSIFGELLAAGGSTAAVLSDDDLATVSNVVQTGGPTQGFDHQTIVSGPPNPNAPIVRQPTGAYPHLWYYASQQVAYASVATSFDGGFSYQAAIPAYNLTQCGGLHGHLRVAPNDGTVYLPNKGCGGLQGAAVSEDNGLTWNVRTVPTSTSGDTDPSIGIGAGGKLYFAYTAGDKHPHVAISDDRGLTWHDDFDLAISPSLTTPLKAAVFMQAIAGDNNRATVFFMATNSTNPNDPTGTDGVDAQGMDPNGTADDFFGTWYPYMATTCDGGKSWSIVRADNNPLFPGVANPVQQGVICTNGTTCPDDGTHDTRNLLDFNEIGVDSRGRAVAVYADGCNFDHPCINITNNTGNRNTNQSIARLTIIRQRGGSRLFSIFDPGGPAAPTLSPPVFVEEQRRGGYQVKWATPDDNGSPLTSYRIYRGQAGHGEKLVAEVKPNINSFNDRNATGRLGAGFGNFYYRVTAVNKFGESPRNNKVFPSSNGE